MSLAATLDALEKVGASSDVILAVVRAHLAAEDERLEARRLKDAARQRAKRTRDVTQGHAVSRGQAVTTTDTAPRTRVENLTSSLRSEDTSEAKASSVSASKPAPPEKPKTKPPKSIRGTRLPEDWEPTEADVTLARDEGLTDEEIHRAAVEFRNYWCARTRDATKLSWPKTWHNRIIDVADRKRRNGARLASAAGQPGGYRRGSSSFADIYARRHGASTE